MMTRDERVEAAVTAALGCVGVPFHHQGRSARSGLDCIGLVIVALKAAGIEVRDRMDYGLRPDGVLLARGLVEHGGMLVSACKAGDVLLFRFGGRPQHVGLALSEDEMVHSFAPAGRVVRCRLGNVWTRRLVGVYRVI